MDSSEVQKTTNDATGRAGARPGTRKAGLRLRLSIVAGCFLVLLLSLVASLKLHLHIPLCRNQKGKVEYVTVLTHQSALDTFGFAQEHDRQGQTDLATIDYRMGIANRGFRKLPDKIKATLLELVDCRDNMDSSDYFDELLTHSRIGFWRPEQMPLRVYVPDGGQKDGFNEFDHSEIQKCFDEWCSIVPGKLSYKFVDAPENADILFSQKEHPVELSFSRFVLAHTIPQPAGPAKWSVFPASKATVEPLRMYPEIQNYDDRRARMRHMVFLHEIGHSLGIIGHSANAGDLMFFSGTDSISERDKETMRHIYSSGSIYEKAEQVLRRRAAAGDKYALLQLAAEIDQCGTASPSELKEVFALTKRAADLGSGRAKLNLGWMYHEGNGVRRDLTLASKYFHEASSQGIPSALLALSAIYEKGDGVAQNLQTAEKYLKLALRLDLNKALTSYANFLTYEYADKGSQELAVAFYKKGCGHAQVESLSRLALLYEHGQGVFQDLHEAELLRAKARKQLAVLEAHDAAEYFARACAYAEIFDSEKAIADYTEALRLKPDFRGGYLGRGAAWQSLGDNQAAIKDMTAALKLDPDCDAAYLGLAYSNLGLGNAATALQDVNSLLARTRGPDSDRLYGLIVGALACRSLHDDKQADELLEQALAMNPGAGDSWPRPIVKFLRHKIGEDDFARQALGYSRSTEVHFYMAMDQSFSGRVEDAIANFRWVKDNGDKTFYEYPVALAQLDRLQKAPLSAGRF